MTTLVESLKDQKNELSRQALHLLNEKGDRAWTMADQRQYDGFIAQIELLGNQIDAHANQHLSPDRFFNTGKKDHQHQLRGKWMREGTLNKAEWQRISNAQSEVNQSQGGYTVITEVAKQWVDRIAGFGAMRRLSGHVVSEKSGFLGIPTSDGVSEEGEVATENYQATSADATFGLSNVAATKFSSKIIAVPFELIQDAAFDIVSFVEERQRNRIGRLQNRKFTVGSGTGEPTGLLTAAQVGRTGAAGQTSTVLYDDLMQLLESVDAAYEDEGPLSWQFSQAMRTVVRGIKDLSGRPIWMPSMDSGRLVGTPDLLLGHPVVVNNHMPAPGASAKTISFGQHKRYVVNDRLDVSMYRFEDSAYMAKGQVGFLCFARAGGNLVDQAAVKLYQHPAA